MHKSFDTPGPTKLYVELGAGDLNIHATDTPQTVVDIDGQGADDVIVVEQRGDQVVVVAKQRWGFSLGGTHELTVTVTLPTGSDLVTKTGSADLVATGTFALVKVKSGSGEVQIEHIAHEAVLETGSGTIEIAVAEGAFRAKAGSGDVQVGRMADTAVVSTGSGDTMIGTAEATLVVKSGSGDVQVKEARSDLSVTTASGDLRVGVVRRGDVRLTCVSGDVHVGVPAGIPVWTDISCVSGQVSSSLEGAGQPVDGQDFIEIRAKTVSGNVHLEQM